ncbi:MAG: hypothetical protein AB1765_06030 [Candidatus Hydrogenedentota bacterium]
MLRIIFYIIIFYLLLRLIFWFLRFFLSKPAQRNSKNYNAKTIIDIKPDDYKVYDENEKRN